MKIINTIKELRSQIQSEKIKGKLIGFVPTMGFLHKGHLSLMKQAKKECDIVVVSIFVNPTQFGPNEDFDRYPRNLEMDKSLCESEGVDIIFYPDKSEIYPNEYQTFINVTNISKGLCGAKRLNHFEGVATVVTKLFNIVSPHKSYFGKKDYQQYLLIKQMVSDLNLDIEVIGMPIIREEDGLAMSSRNANLTPDNRILAGYLNKGIGKIINLFKNGENNPQNLILILKDDFESKNIKIDYIEIRNKNTLQTCETIDENSMIFIAVFVGNIRLIDNRSFN